MDEIITQNNEHKFCDMIKSEKAFFLISTFKLCQNDSEFKLSETILKALFRGKDLN